MGVASIAGRALTFFVCHDLPLDAGNFDFSVHKEFRDAYIQFEAGKVCFILDLSRTEYMDRSALGMVLLLREYIGDEKSCLEIRNARPEVEKILRIANFDKLLELRCV